MTPQNRPILLCDMMNVFTRAYSVDPSMSVHGTQIGGVTGTLKTIARLTREINPSRIIVAWEGGGSPARRKIYSEYKKNRKQGKLNRFYEDDIPDSEENKVEQIQALVGILSNVPVCQLYTQDAEGDDIISYVCRRFSDTEKIIASSDKDFYQLLDNKTKIYSLHKKKIVTDADILSEFNVSSTNFALAKCLCGDTSDNIPGIKGIGFKTVAKKFPILCETRPILVDELMFYAHARKDERVYKNVVDGEQIIRRNWRLIYLDAGILSSYQTQKIDSMIDTWKPNLDKIGLVKRFVKEGIRDFDIDSFLYPLRILNL